MDNIFDGWWTMMIDDNSRYFERYLSLIKNMVDEDDKKLKKRVGELKDSKPIFHEDYGGYDPKDELSDTVYEMCQIEQLMYRSFVVGVFIFMESRINEICGSIKKKQDQKLSYRDLNGSGVGRSINYIQKVLDIKFPVNDEIRKEFEVSQIIRNALVHSEGEIKDAFKPKINEYLKTHPGVLDWDKNTVVITYDYAKSLIVLNQKVCREAQEQNKVKISSN